MTDTFPRQQARTQKFSLGAPRSFQISPDGSRIAFLRSKSGTDPVTCLWVLDLPADPGQSASDPRLVVDPVTIGTGADEPEEERARRERSRESASGVVAFATDAAFTMAAFAVSGQVYTTGLAPDGPGPAVAKALTPAIDPRPDPTGQRVAYVCDGAVRITDPQTGMDTELIGPHTAGPSGPDGPAGPAGSGEVTYGLAEYVAAEEMGRHRGYWWAPDGSAMLVARVDNSPVNQWFISDPANPDHRPTAVRYPAAGSPNAAVSLLVVGLGGGTVAVSWDAETYPYLATADWDAAGPLIVVQTRDQRHMRLLAVDPATGATSLVREDSDPHWVDIVPGVPGRTSDGRIVWTTTAGGTRRLIVATADALVGGSAEPVTPEGLNLREVLSVDGNTVLFSASDEPTEIGVWAYGPGGLTELSAGDEPELGAASAVRTGGTTVLFGRSLEASGLSTTVLREQRTVATIESHAEQPLLHGVHVTLMSVGERDLRAALVLPHWYEPDLGLRLPVLMDPYGGPHGQRVRAQADDYLTSQWFADQGFAVIVADGRGTPGRGPDWDRAVAGDLSACALEDQADALAAVADLCATEQLADLDLTKVAIRGWSFGGFLAALAVLRRPDVFHAAVAGAPVTEWRLYDTHYTERYLGDPNTHPEVYDRSSLLADAPKLTRPLMIIHGLADDNVAVAHTLRLSSALLEAGRPHSVLPLTGVTHMATQEEVAENLLLLQVDFLRKALGIELTSWA
ncbi:MAG TPA: prolyl oligopeptidase family serine peptidase [Streptosporangiaceae bacterium]|nr:prolyl oligopeptidase family serine peptidase [Streptosporangiaceae bacterium]